MGVNGRTKGSTFERLVANRLGAWWGAKFHRTPQSGGSQLKEGFGLAGDVVTDAKDFPFHIECKKQEGWELSHLLTSERQGMIGAWVDQTIRDCPADKLPLLVFTRNRHDILVMICARNVAENRQARLMLGQPCFELHLPQRPVAAWVGLFSTLLQKTKEEVLTCRSMITSASNVSVSSSGLHASKTQNLPKTPKPKPPARPKTAKET